MPRVLRSRLNGMIREVRVGQTSDRPGTASRWRGKWTVRLRVEDLKGCTTDVKGVQGDGCHLERTPRVVGTQLLVIRIDVSGFKLPRCRRVLPVAGIALPGSDVVLPGSDVVLPGAGVVLPRTDVVPPRTDVVPPRTDVVPPGAGVVLRRASVVLPRTDVALPGSRIRFTAREIVLS
jgi:hypothetical protein